MAGWKNRIVETRLVKASDLQAHPDNPRRHPQTQANVVQGLLDEVGIVDSLIVYESARYGGLVVIDGHLRKELGGEWPCAITDLTDEEADLVLATYHPSGDLATMDETALGVLLGRVTMTPVEDESVRGLLAQLAEQGNKKESGSGGNVDVAPPIDKADELQAKWGVATGQVWQIGPHFVICGDCREENIWARLLGAAKIEAVNGVFTSPPYAERRKQQYGGVPADKYVEWWDALQANVKSNLRADGSLFVNIKPHCEDSERVLYVMDLVIAMKRRWQWHFIEELSWRHTNSVPGDYAPRFRNGFEPIFHFSLSVQIKHDLWAVARPIKQSTVERNASSVRNRHLGKGRVHSPSGSGFNRNLDKLTSYETCLPDNVLELASESKVAEHPAPFPVTLPTFFVRAYSDPGDAWCDPFLGSGTTIVAAHQNGRIGLGIEKLPKYMGVILERLKEVVGEEPCLIEGV